MAEEGKCSAGGYGILCEVKRTGVGLQSTFTNAANITEGVLYA